MLLEKTKYTEEVDKEPMPGTADWLEKRLDEILLQPNHEKYRIKMQIGKEVFSLDQCVNNYEYLVGSNGYQDLYSTLIKKSADYAQKDNVFSNFLLCETVGISAEDGIKVRMCDKVSRIKNLLTKEPSVVGESLADSRCDLAGYLTLAYLLNLYLLLKKGQQTTHQN